jgi:restriction system protein
VLDAVERCVPPTPFEASTYPNGPNARRYERVIRYLTINTVKAGWMVKDRGHWSVTNEGRRVYDEVADPAALYLESRRRFWQ